MPSPETMKHSPVSLPAYTRLLRGNRNFRFLWMAQIVSEIGDWLYTVAIYSLLLEFTGSAKAVALAFVLQVLPQFFIAPAAGVLNDRLSRRRVMMAADWLRGVIVLGMLFARSPEWVGFIYALLFLETTMWAMFEPGRASLVPTIASPEERIVANSLSSITWSFNLAVGAAVGGFVAALWGRDTVFVVNALSFAASALLVQRIRAEEPHLRGAAPLQLRDLFDFTPIAEGVRYVRRDARMVATMFVKCGLGLMGTNWVILTIYGERIFPVSLGGFGASGAAMLGMSFLMGSRGVGALLGPLIGAYWAGHDKARLRRGILYGFLVGACGYFALSLAPTLPLACLAVVVAHAGGSTIWVFSTTLLQAQVEDRFRGRVFSAEFAFSMLSMSSVSYLAGVLIDGGIAVRAMAAATGAIVLLPALAWYFALALWRGEQPPQAEREAAGHDVRQV